MSISSLGGRKIVEAGEKRHPFEDPSSQAGLALSQHFMGGGRASVSRPPFYWFGGWRQFSPRHLSRVNSMARPRAFGRLFVLMLVDVISSPGEYHFNLTSTIAESKEHIVLSTKFHDAALLLQMAV